MRALRPDQSLAIGNLRTAIAEGNKRVVMQAPTGFGKTVLAAEIVASARRKGKRVLFVVPAISLIDQSVEMFWQQGVVEVGVMQADHKMRDVSQPVQVASVQTLMKREKPDFDVVVIDEVHKWFDYYGKKLLKDGDNWIPQPVIGLSATPWSKGLGDFFSRLIKASTTQQLIDQGLLSDFKVYAPSHPDLSGIRKQNGDYKVDELSTRMQDKKLVADAVETWLEHGRGRPTLCFAVDCAHAQRLRDKFSERGVKVAYQDAFTSSHDRAAIKRDFHTSNVEVVVNVGTLTTGVDWDVRCISMCRPTQSEILLVQIIGRGLRTAPGKDYCLILDHSMNHLKLGFVTDIDANHDELSTGPRQVASVTDRIRLPKECPACTYLKPPGVAVCPQCGFKAVKHSKIEPTSGELKELERKRKEAQEEPINAYEFMAELRTHALFHGYKPGWAFHKFREKFGRNPDDFEVSAQPARTVSERTAKWIRHVQIRWVKGKGRGQ